MKSSPVRCGALTASAATATYGCGCAKSQRTVNVLREVDADLDALNRSLRALNASIGHYIDRLTRNRTPQEVLELFDQYEEKVVAAAYHRFKTSDNLFSKGNREYLGAVQAEAEGLVYGGQCGYAGNPAGFHQLYGF